LQSSKPISVEQDADETNVSIILKGIDIYSPKHPAEQENNDGQVNATGSKIQTFPNVEPNYSNLSFGKK